MSYTYRIQAILEAQDKASGVLNSFVSKLQGLQQQTAGLGSTFKTAFGVGLGYLAARGIETAIHYIWDATQAYAGFEKTLTLASIQGGIAIDQLKETVYSLMDTFGLTSQEASQLALDLVRAGIAGDQLRDVMEAVTAAAIATGEPVENLSGAIIAMMNVFGVTADQAANLITSAGNLAIGTATEFGQALAKVAPLAKAAGLSLEETSAWLVALNNAGITFLQSGMWINNVLRQWQVEQYLFSSFVDDSFTHGSVVLWPSLCTLTGLPQTCSP